MGDVREIKISLGMKWHAWKGAENWECENQNGIP